MQYKILGHCNIADVKKLAGVVQGMIISDSSNSENDNFW